MNQYTQHLDWIDSQHQHMIHLTEAWSRINSGSYHVAGLHRMADALSDNFSWLEGTQERLDITPLSRVNRYGEVEEVPLGQALRIRKRPDAPIQIFLGGHMDTVFPKDSHFQEPVYLDENTLNGPGVADLKGGLVIMLKALEALERSEWASNIGWEVLINPDEEIGSQGSDPLLKESAQRNQLGLIFEPALADGTLAGARKGSGNFHWVVRGVSAHAGREFDKGKNAIVAAVQLVEKLYALNGAREGVTLNIGQIEGGGALNQVPDLAIVRMNTRLLSEADKNWLTEHFTAIEKEVSIQDGIFIERHGAFTRAPKPMSDQNAFVFNLVKETGAMIDLDISWNATGGCCDGNNMWSHGLPNVDTLGVRGGNIHSDKEFALLDSLPERAKLAALILMRIASGEVMVP